MKENNGSEKGEKMKKELHCFENGDHGRLFEEGDFEDRLTLRITVQAKKYMHEALRKKEHGVFPKGRD